MRSFAAALIAVTCIAGPLAAQPSTSPPLFHTEPMVLGQVSEVTSHSVTVTTAKGEQMEFEFDSGTLMPTAAQLTPDTPVKVLFRTLDSGLHLAKRITALEPGSLEYARLEYELAMAESDRNDTMHATEIGNADSDTPIASNASDEYASGRDRNMGETKAEEVREEAREQAGEHHKDYSNVIKSNEDELPRTASAQGWLLPGGVGAVLLAIAARFVRRRRIV